MSVASTSANPDFVSLVEDEPAPEIDSADSSDSDSDTPSSKDSEDDLDEKITPEYLESLLQKARENAAASKGKKKAQEQTILTSEEEVILLDNEEASNQPLPPLDPGVLPPSYFQFGKERHEAPLSIRDPDVERVEAASSSVTTPAPPPPPLELTKSGKPLTKKERKALKKQTAGPSWFDLPAPAEADLPRLYREVEALRLRNQLDPKRFYKKEEGEGKGIKGLPKYFAIGTIMPTSTPFGGASADNLPRSHRKRTLVDELVDDAEAKRYAKKKFEDLQVVRGAKGRGTLHKKNALRKPKW